MTSHTPSQTPSQAPSQAGWLVRYYAARAGFSTAWVVLAFALGKSASPLAGLMLLLYPAWDAAANWQDAARSGGLKSNPSQAFNVAVSVVVTAAVGLALAFDRQALFYVFGAWAFLAGLLQLATGVRRWRVAGAQWPMVLSGAQSAIAGALFCKRALDGIAPSPAGIAPYAAFGALYFAIAAGALAFSTRRGAGAVTPA